MEAKASPQMNMLTGPEFRRLIAKMGGLWSGGALGQVFGARARKWPYASGFPDPAWVTGDTRLFAGWEIYVWLTERGFKEEALRLDDELKQLARRRFDS